MSSTNLHMVSAIKKSDTKLSYWYIDVTQLLDIFLMNHDYFVCLFRFL